MSRDHRSLHNVAELLKKHDRALVQGSGGRHRRVKPSTADTQVIAAVADDTDAPEPAAAGGAA